MIPHSTDEILAFSLVTDQDHVEVDIFPHRIHPAPGVSKIDLALGVLVNEINPQSGQIQDAYRVGALDFDTPLGTVRRGAIAAGKDTTARACRFTIKEDRVHFPNGESCDINAFRPQRALYPNLAWNKQNALESYRYTRDMNPFLTLVLAFVSSLDEAPIRTDFGEDHVGSPRIAAALAMASRVIDFSYPAGREGMRKAADNAVDITNHLVNSWLLAPNRPWAPGHWTATPELKSLVNMFDSQVTAFGTALAGIFPHDLDRETCTSLQTDTPWPSWSAHEKIAFSGLNLDLKHRLEAEAPLTLLKPAARKRQQKRRQA